MSIRRLAALVLVLACSSPSWAGSGILGLDHPVTYDNSGIWKRSNQEILIYGTIATIGAGALWFGDDNKLGDTFWRSVDSMAVTAISTQALKWTFQRERPSETDNPNKWFQGLHAQSFPSGEVAAVTAAVTPFIINYGNDHPAVYLLALLPAYDAVARVKTHGHWQSDVLIGAAIGAGIGVWATHRDSPWILSLLPGGFQVGYVHHFD
ncbi:phosphatase PAP2 family protein [Dyella japonica]|uniref:Phosphoesterase PA-phosphatase n=1 Tax=Dyella japonica DSM 16301 TaxID=1440762 RepID=A0A0G9H6T3_9GAMM|nr:phosphatase PAP2 family protein [Dyella japonica]KLD64959.1 phosphoesterase PA-phosphatase [Dyella japonica DSM 16301]